MSQVTFFVAVSAEGHAWVMGYECDERTEPVVREHLARCKREARAMDLLCPVDPGVWKLQVKEAYWHNQEIEWGVRWQEVAPPKLLYVLPADV